MRQSSILHRKKVLALHSIAFDEILPNQSSVTSVSYFLLHSINAITLPQTYIHLRTKIYTHSFSNLATFLTIVVKLVSE